MLIKLLSPSVIALMLIMGLAPDKVLPPKPFTGKVVAIADGDTVTVLYENQQHKIRLSGIDAPESRQAFGDKSKKALADKVFGKEVKVEWSAQDKYHRILGEIYLGERRISEEMISDGLAWHYKQYSKDQNLAKAELAAKQAKKGLWADANPTPPWDFRNGGASGKQVPSEVDPAVKPKQGVTVYVTDTGEKYHRENCKYLAKSSNPILMEKLGANYQPCKVCSPPPRGAAPAKALPFTESAPPVEKNLPTKDTENLRELKVDLDLNQGIKLDMVLIPAGKFMMGSPLTEKDRSHVSRKGNVKNDETQHEVTLTNPFYLGKYEVTQEQWESVMGDEILKIMPAKARNPQYPMARLNWLDCQEFVKRMNKTGKGFRLPSEAEWEYACRAGTPTAYFFGGDIKKTEANIGFLEDKLSVVGAYKPNKFGLFDTHGNVAEWVSDWYGGDYAKVSVVDPLGAKEGWLRILRGGSSSFGDVMARSAYRYALVPNSEGTLGMGFRLAKSVEPLQPK